jgi:AcrR family transcriptional regulator
MNRPYHHGNLRAALLEAAERALREDGAGDLSLRELAREVGVSHAAPRRHFADKRALLDALAEHGFALLAERLDAAAAARGSFRERLTAVAAAYVEFATERSALLEVMFATKRRPDAAQSLREASDRAFAAPFAVIADGQRSGDVVTGDPEQVSLAVWAAMHGIASLSAGGLLGARDLAALVAETVERLELGLRPR